MKYDAGMTGFHKDIVAAIKSMIHGDSDKVAELAAEGSPVPLRDYLREHHGKTFHGGNKFDCMSSAFLVKFDHIINNDGDTKLQLSWSQVSTFIRKYPSDIFDNTNDEDNEDIIPDKNTLEMLYNTFDESEIKCPFWHTGETMRYLNFGGVDFKCDYCDCSFCEFDKLTDFLASHCHNYEDCPYYCKHKDDKSEFPCDDCGYDVKGCCDYPETPDDYCVCGDKKIPATTQNDTAVAAFDYSELDPDTAAKLENVTAEIFNVRKEYIFTMAKKVAYAHDLLANHYCGKFGLWCESVGISRDTGNNLVRVAELFGNSTEVEQKNLEQLNAKLLYEAARPSAPPELVEQVKSGDITTHKEYIALKKELEEANKKLEDAKFHSKQQSESFDRVADQSSKNYNKYLEEYHKNQDLMKQIRELESRPVDVMVQTDADAERKFNETIRKINLDFEKFRDEADKDLADMRNQRNAALDRAEAAEAKLNAPKAESDVKSFVIRMTMDDYDAIVKALSGNAYLKNIIQKAQVLRV